ncbi:hypothetical protein [uncultured Litoreibacter sp.]|uniref:hypothetical protein n=1 Tax=uncultured Litoreibacter sp. TaxID=1392394 RepID=UPI002604F2E8|nr:hypothetical protein [uncultured Litoreibacter sp.]
MTRIPAPASGVEIRMYRAGHGDCFLLNFRRSKDNDEPFFMLIDCGMKKGSHAIDGMDIYDVIRDLHDHTGGVLDLVVVTHEHEDHVSGFPSPTSENHPFSDFTVKELWLAWTEDETDKDANKFREKYRDQVLTLALAQHKLSAMSGADSALAEDLAEFLELETGFTSGLEILQDELADLQAGGAVDAIPMGMDEATAAFTAIFGAKDAKIKGERYKRRLQGLRHMAKKIKFLSPGDNIWTLPGVDGVQVYPFGPPREKKLLTSLNPHKAEEFHIGPFAMGEPGSGLFAAMTGDGDNTRSSSPFSPRHAIPESEVFDFDRRRSNGDIGFFAKAYRDEDKEDRRIDGDWLQDAESLALRINNEVNNTSLVLAFELPESRQILLFTGDAQRGSWISWKDLSWTVKGADKKDKTVTVRDLLARCTFYKAGHHGSHNATLNGTEDDDHPNINWMAQGDYADHFVTMIPTNKVWAFGKSRPWRHPMKAIEDALFEKAKSRVMMIKTDKGQKTKPKKQWLDKHNTAAFKKMRKEFEGRTEYAKTYVSHWVPDKL